jgi:hypothetical protein
MNKIILGAVMAGVAAGAVTAETLKPDPAAIPKPSAASVFYFVAPTERTGSSVLAEMDGLTTSADTRVFEKMFESRLTSCRPGLIMIVR